MEKIKISVLLLVLIISITSCKAMENNISSNNSISSEQTSKNSSENLEINVTSVIEAESSSSPKPISSKETSSKTDDEKMYEYVQNHQVTTKKVSNLGGNELLKFIEEHINLTYSNSKDYKIKLPDTLVFTKGTIKCTFEQTHVLSPQKIYFDNLVGEFNAEELQNFLAQFNGWKNTIKYFGEELYTSPFVLPKYQELFTTQETAVYLSFFGSLKNTFNASLGTATIPILIYKKENGKYAFHFTSSLNNPKYLIGELEIQSDGSAKVKN